MLEQNSLRFVTKKSYSHYKNSNLTILQNQMLYLGPHEVLDKCASQCIKKMKLVMWDFIKFTKSIHYKDILLWNAKSWGNLEPH